MPSPGGSNTRKGTTYIKEEEAIEILQAYKTSMDRGYKGAMLWETVKSIMEETSSFPTRSTSEYKRKVLQCIDTYKRLQKSGQRRGLAVGILDYLRSIDLGDDYDEDRRSARLLKTPRRYSRRQSKKSEEDTSDYDEEEEVSTDSESEESEIEPKKRKASRSELLDEIETVSANTRRFAESERHQAHLKHIEVNQAPLTHALTRPNNNQIRVEHLDPFHASAAISSLVPQPFGMPNGMINHSQQGAPYSNDTNADKAHQHEISLLREKYALKTQLEELKFRHAVELQERRLLLEQKRIELIQLHNGAQTSSSTLASYLPSEE